MGGREIFTVTGTSGKQEITQGIRRASGTVVERIPELGFKKIFKE